MGRLRSIARKRRRKIPTTSSAPPGHTPVFLFVMACFPLRIPGLTRAFFLCHGGLSPSLAKGGTSETGGVVVAIRLRQELPRRVLPVTHSLKEGDGIAPPVNQLSQTLTRPRFTTG